MESQKIVARRPVGDHIEEYTAETAMRKFGAKGLITHLRAELETYFTTIKTLYDLEIKIPAQDVGLWVEQLDKNPESAKIIFDTIASEIYFGNIGVSPTDLRALIAMHGEVIELDRYNNTKYINDFKKANYDRINLEIPKGRREKWRERAKNEGKSLNNFISEVVEAYIEQA